MPYVSGGGRAGYLYVTNGTLKQATTTLQEQWQVDYRSSLVNDQDQAANWQRLSVSSVLGSNYSPLKLYINADRMNNITNLVISKYDDSYDGSITLDSTWKNNGENLTLFISPGGNSQSFGIRGITLTQDCASLSPLPSHNPSISPSASPSEYPSIAPSNAPSSSPTDTPILLSDQLTSIINSTQSLIQDTANLTSSTKQPTSSGMNFSNC